MRVGSFAVVVTVACSSPPTPSATRAPTAGPAPVAIDDAGPAPDAGPPPLVTCSAGTEAIRLPWPAHGRACVDGDGRRSGPAAWLYPDGTVAERRTYLADVLEGPWQRFTPDGSVAADGAFHAGHPVGRWRQLAAGVELGSSELGDDGTGTLTWWYPDGAAAAQTTWRAGARDGAAHRRLPDGSVWLDETWANGALTGVRVVGTRADVQVSERWRDGVRSGLFEIWRRGGRELIAHRDRRGRLDGDWTAYRSGRPRERGAYLAGLRTGAWTWFDASGNRSQAGSYRRGKRDGAWTEWTGPVRTWTGSYRDGRADGPLITFDASGREVGRDRLVDGTGVVRTFHASGKVATETAMAKGRPHGAYRAVNPRGVVVTTGRYADGVRTGTWQWRDGRGRPLREDHYRRGQLDGTSRRWRDGAVVLEATYDAGVRQGPYVERFADGAPALVGQYRDDRRDGAWLTYRKDGTVALEATYAGGLLDGPWRAAAAAADGQLDSTGQHQAGHRVGIWREGTAAIDYGPPDGPRQAAAPMAEDAGPVAAPPLDAGLGG